MGAAAEDDSGAASHAAADSGGGNAQPTADLVGKLDVMIKALFDIVYLPQAELTAAAAAASVAAAAAALCVGDQHRVDCEEEAAGNEKGAKGKAKAAAAAAAATPAAAPLSPPTPPKAASESADAGREDVWAQRGRLIAQQVSRMQHDVGGVEAQLLRRYSFLKSPPGRLKQLVGEFMLNLGPFQHAPGRPAQDKHTPVLTRDDITALEARQICAADPKIGAFSFRGPPAPTGTVTVEFYAAGEGIEAGSIVPEAASDDGAAPAAAEGEGDGEGASPDSGEPGDAAAKADAESAPRHGYQTYVVYPSVAGEYRLLEGEPREVYGIESTLLLRQAGGKVWGTQERGGGDGGREYFVRGAVGLDRSLKLIISDDAGEGVAGGSTLCFSESNVYSLEGACTDPPAASVIREFAGACARERNIRGEEVRWEYRMERVLGGRATQQQADQVVVSNVSELYENAPGIVSVRFTALPTVCKGMHREPANLSEDFRHIYLNPDMTELYGIGSWMSGASTITSTAASPRLAELLLDVAGLAEFRPALGGGAAGASGAAAATASTVSTIPLDDCNIITPRPPPAGQSGGSASASQPAKASAKQKAKKVQPFECFTVEDVALLGKMNNMMNFAVNPRTLPPNALQPPHALALSVSQEKATRGKKQAKKKKGEESAGGGGGSTLRIRKTPVMNRALPQESERTASDDCIFSASPASLSFPCAFKVGETYSLPLTLTNKDKVSRRCRVSPPADTDCFSVEVAAGPPPNGLVAPGMSVRYTVTFAPRRLETARSRIVVATEWSDFAIPLAAVREAPRVEVNGEALTGSLSISHSDCLIGGTAECVVSVRNVGGWASFSMAPEEDAGGSGAILDVVPEVFSLEKDEERRVVVRITPRRIGDAATTLALQSDEGSVAFRVVLRTNAVRPNLQLGALDGGVDGAAAQRDGVGIEFGEASLGSQAARSFPLTNASTVQASCRYLYESADAFGRPTAAPAFTMSNAPASAESPFASQKFTVAAGQTVPAKVLFSPADEGVYEGTVRLLMCDVPPPDGPDHPLHGREVVHATGTGYLVCSLRLSGFGSGIRLEVEPSTLDAQTPVLMRTPTTREVTLRNHGTRDVAFVLDPPDSDEAAAREEGDRRVHKAAGAARLNYTEVVRGMVVSFAPRTGVVPRRGSVTVAATYSSLVVGDFYAKVAVLFDAGGAAPQRLHLELMGEAVTPALACGTQEISFVSDGALSPAVHASGRGVERKVTVSNPSPLPVALHAYCYADVMRMHGEDEAASAASASDAGPTQALYRCEPEIDLLMPQESKEIAVTVYPPAEACVADDVLTIVAAPFVPQHQPLLESIAVGDLLAVRERGDFSLMEAVSILLGCTPPLADTLVTVLDQDPAAALHHLKHVNVSRKGLDLMTVLADSKAMLMPAARAGFLQSLVAMRLVENSTLLGRLSGALRTATSPTACKVLAWAKLAASFLQCLRESRTDVRLRFEVQRAACRVTPSVVELADMYKDVAASATVTLKNTSGVPALYRWAMLDGQTTNVSATAQPSEGVLPPYSSVTVRLGVTQHSSAPIDLLLPCVVKDVPLPGMPEGDGGLVGVSITSGQAQSIALSVEDAAAPLTVEGFCRHLVEDLVRGAVDEAPAPLLPALSFDMEMFKTAHAELAVRHQAGGEVSYTVRSEGYPTPFPRNDAGSALMRESALRLLDAAEAAAQPPSREAAAAAKRRSASMSEASAGRGSYKSGGYHSRKSREAAKNKATVPLAKADAALRFTSVNGRRQADDKAHAHELLNHAYAMLSLGRGFAVEVPRPSGVLSRLGAGSEAAVPIALHADLPGEYSDTLVLEVSDDAVAPAHIPLRCRVTGCPLTLVETTPGLFLPPPAAAAAAASEAAGEDPTAAAAAAATATPRLSFPTHLVAPAVKRTKYFKVENPCRVDIQVVWRLSPVTCSNLTGEAATEGEGEEEAATPPCLMEVSPESCVVEAGRSASFTVAAVMTRSGAFCGRLTCEARTARTPNNLVYLRSGRVQANNTSAGGGGGGNGDDSPGLSASPSPPQSRCGSADPDELLEERWRQEALCSTPLCLDVAAAAVDNGLTAEPALLQLRCRGAPLPVDRVEDGFVKTLRLTNPVAAPQDFRVLCDPPFTLAGFALRRGGVEARPLAHGAADNDGLTLFQLRTGDALDLRVELPWGADAAATFRGGGTATGSFGASASASATTSSGLMTMKGRPAESTAAHHKRGRVDTQDVRRVEGAVRITYANGSTQAVPVLALVSYPALRCSPQVLAFGERADDRNPAWSKRLFLEALTSAPVNYRIVHKPKFRPITKLTTEESQQEGVKKVLQRETVRHLQGDGERKLMARITAGDPTAVAHGVAPIDDPRVFEFDKRAGAAAGVTAAEARKEEICVRFAPCGTEAYESAFVLEVEGGRGCEFTLRGQSAETEYGQVAAKTVKKIGGPGV